VRILGIESSCDETSAAVVETGGHVLSNVIASSSHTFHASGGVVPEDAARKQVEYALPVVHEALQLANCDHESIELIAVTYGPGLLGSLLVGTTLARTLGSMWGTPVVGIHHTFGHLSSTWLHDGGAPNVQSFPILTLSASGGHTDLWLRTSHVKGELLGRTRDDAAGEAFDKGASMLGLPYPGGPSIARNAEGGNITAFPFPLPLHDSDTLDFSFSGLKTALKYTMRDAGELSPAQLQDLAASYQHAICLHLVDRIRRAVKEHACNEVHLVGGVSANTALRLLVQDAVSVPVRWPQHIRYCTDNAAMIACAAGFLLQENPIAMKNAWSTSATAPLEAFLER
jgi:N6-L-threonylcarbamoyladenine synthase